LRPSQRKPPRPRSGLERLDARFDVTETTLDAFEPYRSLRAGRSFLRGVLSFFGGVLWYLPDLQPFLVGAFPR